MYKNVLFVIAYISIIDILKVDSLSGCGHPTQSQYFIINGEPAKELSWPWMALINIRSLTNSSESFLCGGTIVSEQYVLTAGHCFSQFLSTEDFETRVYLGKHQMLHSVEKMQVNRTGKVTVHEKFNHTYTQNDVALIKLNQSLDFIGEHKHLQPICLPDQDYDILKEDCEATGWGHINQTNLFPTVLQQIKLPLLNDSYCQKEFNRDLNYNQHPGSKLCAGYDAGGKGMCHGDSGGPLVCPLKNGTYIQYGIVSYHYGLCASQGWPEVFTRVPYFYDWIHKHLK